MIILAELKKLLGLKRKCFCCKTITVLSEWTVPKIYDATLLHF